MAREDFNRRRLRGMYERNKHRVSALADARDRRRDGADDELAPRRYIVSEHRTRVEGFGRGGQQVRRVVRIIERRPRGSRRFSDRGLFRRGGRDRFVRDDDFDREIRRERGRDIERRRRGGRGGDRNGDRAGERVGERRRGDGGSRFGVSRRLRLREKDLKREQLRRGGRRGGNGDNNNNSGSKDGGRRGGGRRGERRGDKEGRRQPQQKQQPKQQQQQGHAGGRGGGRGGRGGRERDGPMPSHADLDRQLDSYRGH